MNTPNKIPPNAVDSLLPAAVEATHSRFSWSAKSRAERRRLRNIAIGAGTAIAVLALAVVVIANTVGGRSGTFVSPVACASTTASNLRFDPTTGAEGAGIYITGTNFADVTDVKFNGTSVTSFTVVSPTEITTAVPGGATNGPIAIVSKTTPITSDTCFVTTSPAIASFSPAAGATGTSLTVTGANFTGATAVKFSGLAIKPTSVTATSITVAVPANAVSGLISVETPVSTAASTGTFTVSSPAISSFSPALGATGTTVTITGANLSGATAVRFGTTPAASFSVVSATTVTATVPANLTSGPISITAPAGTATASDDFAAPPTISSFTPTTASPGSTVTITGTNLTSVSWVSFTGSTANATFTVVSPTQITATVPNEALTGPVSVRGTALAVSTTALTIGPSVTSLWPISGPAGTVVTITGFNLGGPTAVTFNGVAALFQAGSATQLTATVPAGSTNGTVTVRTATGSANSQETFGTVSTPTLVVDPAGPVSVPRTSSGTTPPSTTVPAGAPRATTAAPAGSVEFICTLPKGFVCPPTVTFPPPPTTIHPTTTTPTTIQPSTTAATATTAPGTSQPATTAPVSVTTSVSAAGTVGSPTTLSGGQIVLTAQVGTTAPNASGVPTWSGTAQASFGTLRIPVSLTYTNDTAWTLLANAATATVAIRAVNLSIGSLSGSITATPTATVWDLRGTLAAPASFVGDSGATKNGKLALLGGTVSILPSCPTFAASTSLCSASAATTVYLSIAVVDAAANPGFFANLGSGLPLQASGTYQAAVNLTSRAFVMEGLFATDATASLVTDTGNIAMSALSIRIAASETTFAVLAGDIIVDSGSANGGFDVLVRGDGRINIPKIGGWNLRQLSVAYADGGTVTVGSISNKPKLGDASMSSIAYFSSQQDVSAKILGTVVRIPPRTYVFAGSLPTPKWLNENLGIPKDNFGVYATYTTSGLIKISAVIPASIKLPPIPHVKTTITSFVFTAILNLEPKIGSELGFQLAANGTMEIDGNSPIDLVLAAKYVSVCAAAGPAIGPQLPGVVAPTVCYAENSPTFTIAISAVGTNGASVWPNIFGITGLNLTSVALQIGITPGIWPYVSVGLAGDGTLPGKLREYMGIDSNENIPVSFVMNLSTVSPCLSVNVGNPDSATPIMALPAKSEIVTATFFSLLVSPIGCSVGIFDVPAGVQIRAKAKVFAVAVNLFAAYNPNPSGPPGAPKTPSMRAWLTVDNPNPSENIRVDGSLRIFAAYGGFTLLPRVDISGGIKVGGAARIDIFGSCNTITGCTGTGSGALSIGGFNLTMAATVKRLGTALVAVEATGALSVAGVQVTVSGSYEPGSYAFSGSGTFPNGGVLKSFEVGFSQSIANNFVPKAVFRASGSFGGRFKSETGASGAFSTAWVDLTPNISKLNLVMNPRIDLGLITVPAKLGFVVCLSGPCAGTVTPKFNFSSTFKGIPFNIPDTDLDGGWGFNASTSAYFSGSDSVGSKWGGLRGDFSGNVTLGISSADGLTVDPHVTVHGEYGAGGKWRGFGTYGADVDFSGSRFRFCKHLKGRDICIP